MGYIAWAVLGMAGYSAVTLFVKLAARTGEFTPFASLAIATAIVASSVMCNAILTGGFAGKTLADFAAPGALWSYATGIALTIAVGSLFKGLAAGPASVVVPIYGMFILGGTMLGIIFLGEPLTLRKILGLLLAAAGTYLVAG